jgi:hypothetical protein
VLQGLKFWLLLVVVVEEAGMLAVAVLVEFCT